MKPEIVPSGGCKLIAEPFMPKRVMEQSVEPFGRFGISDTELMRFPQLGRTEI